MISNQYKELFALVARNGAINGEKAMDVLKNGNPEADIKATAATPCSRILLPS